MKGVTLPGLTVEPLTDEKIDAMLVWLHAALRIERALPWFHAIRPRAHIYRVPPSVN